MFSPPFVVGSFYWLFLWLSRTSDPGRGLGSLRSLGSLFSFANVSIFGIDRQKNA